MSNIKCPYSNHPKPKFFCGKCYIKYLNRRREISGR